MKNITSEELKSRLDAGEKINLLDVREDDERAEFNIGGIHQKVGQIQMFDFGDELENLKEEEIVVYCRSGRRSVTAATIMEMAGFQQVTNLDGGMLDWQEKFGGGNAAK